MSDSTTTTTSNEEKKQDEIQWPVKKRDLHNHHFDSTMWDGFEFRDDDIIIGTYAKSGTTWTQQIISQLVFNGDTEVDTANISPWVDLRVPPREVKMPAIEEQTHRRFLKTHLPVDALNFSPKAKYVYLARDGRDVCWSLFNHHKYANEIWYNALNETPGLVGPKIEKPCSDDVVEYYREWITKDGHPFWSFFENIQTWWEIRDLPNVMIVHFADLKKDMPGQMRKMAQFLEIDIDEDKWDSIVEHCTFDWMKNNPSKIVPLNGVMWEGGASTFIHKGTNGRWKDLLTKEDCDKYEKMAEERLGKECADWLKNGTL